MKQLLWLVLAVLCVQMAVAQSPRKVGEVYETHVVAVFADNFETSESLTPALVTVRPAELNNGITSVTLELTNTVNGPKLIRVPSNSLPEVSRSVLAANNEMWLDVSQWQRTRSGVKFDLTAPPAQVGSANYEITVYDAAGNPANDVRIDVIAGLSPGKALVPVLTKTLGADGKFSVSAPRAPIGQQVGKAGQYINQPYAHMRVVATHPSGQTNILSMPSVFNATQPGTNIQIAAIYLAFMPTDNPAAFKGRIVDANNSSVGSVDFGLNSLTFPGKGLEQFDSSAPKMRTAGDGSFSVGVPIDLLEKKMGIRQAPPGSTLDIFFAEQLQARLEMGKDNLIKLPYKEKLQFQLVGMDGAPLPGLKQENTMLWLIKLDDTPEAVVEPNSPAYPIQLKFKDAAKALLDVGEVAVPGKYALRINDYIFQPQKLEKGANSQPVIWKVTAVEPADSLPRATVKGRVLAAENGAPVAGAYVISSFEQTTPWKLVSLSPVELESAWNKWASGDRPTTGAVMIDVEVTPSVSFSLVDGMTKTDAEGNFTVEYLPGSKPQCIHVFIPGRLGASSPMYRLGIPDLSRVTTVLPDVALPLAATANVTALAPATFPDKFLKGEVDGKNLYEDITASARFEYEGAWPVSVFKTRPDQTAPWELILKRTLISPGTKVSVPVPAGVKFSVELSAPYQTVLGRAVWQDVGPLRPGESIALPDKIIPVKIPFIVSVKNSNGTPAAGVSVRLDLQLPLTTDAQGNAIGWSEGFEKKIQVMTDKDLKVAAEKTNVTIGRTSPLTKVEIIIP